jgi:uncharacterized protein (DUF983 family)
MIPSLNGFGDKPHADGRPTFAHQPWMVGMILIFAVLAIIAGLSDPMWFLLGLPCILVLVLYIYVRIKSRANI